VSLDSTQSFPCSAAGDAPHLDHGLAITSLMWSAYQPEGHVCILVSCMSTIISFQRECWEALSIAGLTVS